MYIGPWQEYKLAKLIQHHQEQQTPSAQRRPSSQTRLRPPVPRQRRCLESPSSTRSGVSFNSTQSAPAQLPAQSSSSSAQSRLNDFYEHWEHNTRQEATGGAAAQQTRRLPPRPRSSSSTGKPKAGAKRRPKAKAGPSLEDERRARILHMKRLYGLGEPDAAPEVPLAGYGATASSMSRVDSTASLGNVDRLLEASPQPAPAPAVDANSFTPDFDRALFELQASMDVREEPHPEPLSGKDPMALSMSLESMNGSGGLIAWSKNLRPEDLSSDVTLASFL